MKLLLNASDMAHMSPALTLHIMLLSISSRRGFFPLLPFPLCSLLPARPPPAGEPRASGVRLKAELLPCVINGWRLCQSICSRATSCNKSHLNAQVGRFSGL